MAKVIEGEGREFSDPNDLTTQVSEYMQVKNSMEMLEARQKELRSAIFEQIESNGEFDDKGNIYLELPVEVAGISRLEKQKRVSRKIDELTAEEILKENNLEDEVYETIRVVSEDKLMAAFYEGKLTEDELERIYPAKIVWALTTKKK